MFQEGSSVGLGAEAEVWKAGYETTPRGMRPLPEAEGCLPPPSFLTLPRLYAIL